MTAHAVTEATSVGEIAVHLPGAAEIFRAHGIGFVQHPRRSSAEAAASCGADADALLDRLAALGPEETRSATDETAALIDHALTRYHETHRRDLAELIPLAREVESVQGDHEAAPRWLVDFLSEMLDEMEDHMVKEEEVLFPAMREGGHPMLVHPIAIMRAEHESHGEQLLALAGR